MTLARFEESRFSVIVPAHNAADTLADCLRAILISSAHLDEVIVFNDGSTDDTLKIAQGFPVQVLSQYGAASRSCTLGAIGVPRLQSPKYWFLLMPTSLYTAVRLRPWCQLLSRI